MKGPKASCASLALIFIMSMMFLLSVMLNPIDMICFAHAKTHSKCYAEWGEAGSHAIKMGWALFQFVVRFIWKLAWDVIETLDNQHLGIRTNMKKLIIKMGLTPTLIANVKLGFPRRHMILSEFMLCPVFEGNAGLSVRNERFMDGFKSKERKTNLERVADILEKLHDYCMD